MRITKEKPAIECKNVSKDFYILDKNLSWRIVFRSPRNKLNSFKALNNVNLEVPKGKFVGILGRNGAGKSTLLRVLAGVYEPSTGKITVADTVNGLFEMGGMGSNRLSGYAYANRFLEMHGINKKDRPQLINNIHEFSELGEYFYKPIYSYSSGMSARLYFSTATELQHEIYLVDELLSVGDEHFQAKCWKRLRDRFTQGASGILVTHDWSAVLKICECSYILDKGAIVLGGASDFIVQRYLNLPKPTGEYAQLMVNPEGYTLECNQNGTIEFDILVKKEMSIAVNYSIELFRGGYGWEIMTLNEHFIPIDTRLGLNTVALNFKKLPLVSGSYYLNLFLKSVDNTIDLLRLDGRSWTYGNGIPLRIIGQKLSSAIILPWENQLKETNNDATS